MDYIISEEEWATTLQLVDELPPVDEFVDLSTIILIGLDNSTENAVIAASDGVCHLGWRG